MSRPSKKTERKKAGRVVRKTLADGTVREYRYKAYKTSTPSPRLDKDSLASLVRAFKASPEWRGFSPKTVEFYSTYLKPLDDLGHYKARDVTRRGIAGIRSDIASHRGNGAANAFSASVSALFSWAVENGWVQVSPVYKMKRIAGGELPAWTPEQAVAAINGLPEHYRRVVILGLYTGQRRGDLCALRWDDYDGERLHIVQGKTKAEVWVTCPPDLKAELDTWQTTRTAETILTNRWGQPCNPESLTVHLPEELQKLGMPKGLNVHGMRKLFAAGMAGRGATTHEIASNTGHKTLSMIQHYTVSADQRKLSENAVGKIQTFTTDLQDIENL